MAKPKEKALLLLQFSGWNHLRVDIVEEADVSDNYKAYAAGVLEGFLSRSRIRDFFLNTRGLISGRKGGSEAIELVREIFRKSIDRIKEIGIWDESNPLNSTELTDPIDQLVRLAVFQVKRLILDHCYISLW